MCQIIFYLIRMYILYICFVIDVKMIGSSAKKVTENAKRCEGSLVDVISIMQLCAKDMGGNPRANVVKIENSFTKNDKQINDFIAKTESASNSSRKTPGQLMRNIYNGIDRMSASLQPMISLTAHKYNDPISNEKKDSMKYIPSHEPPFPFTHTYKATPVQKN